MSRLVRLSVLAAASSMLAASLGAGLLWAHHGRGESFDMNTELTLNGRVSEVRWRNPHVTIYLDVVDDAGNTVTWGFENSNVSTLARQGYNRNTLRIGQEVTAIVNPSAAGAPLGIVVAVILEDGTEIMSRRRGQNPVD
jgi:hypothetical protein